MASYQILGGIPYSEHLQLNAYVKDVTNEIQQSRKAGTIALNAEVGRLVASNEMLRQSYGRGFDEATYSINLSLETIGDNLSDLTNAVEDMHETMREAFALLFEQLVIQNSLLRSIQEKLDGIHKTLESPLLTQARELYNLGCERLSRGLLDKAVEAFLAAESKNDTDFSTQLRLGKLYLYGIDDDDNVVDLALAEKHLRAACRYGRADLQKESGMRLLLSDAYHCLIGCLYASAGEAKQLGTLWKPLLQSALTEFSEADTVKCAASQTIYKGARIAALLDDSDTCISLLTRSFSSDRRYCVSVLTEADFTPVREAIVDHFDKLRSELVNETRGRLEFLHKYDSHICRDKSNFNRNKYKLLIDKAEKFLSTNTLLDVWEARDITVDLKKQFEIAIYREWIVTKDRWDQIESELARNSSAKKREAELFQRKIEEQELHRKLAQKISEAALRAREYSFTRVFERNVIVCIPFAIIGAIIGFVGGLIKYWTNNSIVQPNILAWLFHSLDFFFPFVFTGIGYSLLGAATGATAGLVVTTIIAIVISQRFRGTA